MPAHHWVVLRHSEKDSRSKGYPLQTKEDIHPTCGFGPTESAFFVPIQRNSIGRVNILKNGAIYEKNLYLCTLK